MSLRPGGKTRAKSATYSGQFVVHPPIDDDDPFSVWSVGIGGNAHQRRKQVREAKRAGYLVKRGGVAS